jgi:hypothetical protein
VSNLPKEIRKQLKDYVSKASDEAIDLVVNLSGRYIDRRKKEKVKKKAQVEVCREIEEVISRAYQIGLDIRDEYQQNKVEAYSLKEKFYLITDTLFKSLKTDVPENMHAIDYLFQICKELKDFRFNFRYLKKTNYTLYLQDLEKLMVELEREHKISESWRVLEDFKSSKDFYPLLQATFQRVIKYYEFLAQNFPKIKKKQLDKYLEIYEGLSAIYEKFASLIVVLLQLLQTKNGQKYEAVRKRGLFRNLSHIEKSGWKLFISGFNRNIRNATVHKTYKVDIVKEIVEFIDRDKTDVLTFKEVQKETRELSALVLILPHVFILVFCMAILSMKEMLDSFPKQERKRTSDDKNKI